jgi:SSS family transporter
MSPTLLLTVVLLYFLLLGVITFFTSKDDSNSVFFKAGRNSPWYVVAFGMIGASLSGVTFISVPGWVGTTQFSYLQIVVGYFLGYLLISWILIPLYYKMNVTSIYEYLKHRFGKQTHKTGAFFFLISRLLIASFRLFLVASVVHHFILSKWGVPFEATVVASVLFIWLYTFRSGIKTIVWTDTLQTLFMLSAVLATIFILLNHLDISLVDLWSSQAYEKYSKIIFYEDINERKHWLKSLMGGMIIALAMTGLDQDNMQKNLTCKSIKEAQKNVVSLGIVLIPVNFAFLFLGAVLFLYADQMGIAIPVVDGSQKSDLLFPEIALNQGLGPFLGITFLLGLIAAAYSSADSALTSLTTSFSIDFLDIRSREENKRKLLRKRIHILFSMLLVAIIIAYKYVIHENVIHSLLQVSSYTYGPLVGLFSFGLLTRFEIKDRWVWVVAALSIASTYLLNHYSQDLLLGYQFGYEILLFNGAFTYAGLYLIRKRDGNDRK